MKHAKSITKFIEEMNDGDDTQVGFSGISERRDKNPCEKIKNIKKRLRRYCHSKGFLFIDNRIVYDSLNKSLLHLSRYVNRLFFWKSRKCIKGLLTY